MEESYGGHWTESKLDILKKYLDAYTSVLKNRPFNLMYIDAFAGTGWVELPQEEMEDSRKFTEGSAKIAVGIDNRPFDKLVFIENDEARHQKLLNLKQDNIIIEKSDANEYLRHFCSNWDKEHRKWRGVLFLDPFATQVEWTTVESIANTRALDTWILFPVSAISRMLPRTRRPEDINPKWSSRLDTIFGDESWKELYRPNPQPDLFGKNDDYYRDPGVGGIINIYKEKLNTILGERLLDESFSLVNSKNSRLFELIFCVGNPAGQEIAHKIARSIMQRLSNPS